MEVDICTADVVLGEKRVPLSTKILKQLPVVSGLNLSHHRVELVGALNLGGDLKDIRGLVRVDGVLHLVAYHVWKPLCDHLKEEPKLIVIL